MAEQYPTLSFPSCHFMDNHFGHISNLACMNTNNIIIGVPSYNFNKD